MSGKPLLHPTLTPRPASSELLKGSINAARGSGGAFLTRVSCSADSQGKAGKWVGHCVSQLAGHAGEWGAWKKRRGFFDGMPLDGPGGGGSKTASNPPTALSTPCGRPFGCKIWLGQTGKSSQSVLFWSGNLDPEPLSSAIRHTTYTPEVNRHLPPHAIIGCPRFPLKPLRWPRRKVLLPGRYMVDLMWSWASSRALRAPGVIY